MLSCILVLVGIFIGSGLIAFILTKIFEEK